MPEGMPFPIEVGSPKPPSPIHSQCQRPREEVVVVLPCVLCPPNQLCSLHHVALPVHCNFTPNVSAGVLHWMKMPLVNFYYAIAYWHLAMTVTLTVTLAAAWPGGQLVRPGDKERITLSIVQGFESSNFRD